ncbi:MAG TPA: M28 family peptidase [Bryobacteraceae bacterium]|nr:M28 family peptidase [Bryobacteraceae bacterium]
MTAVLIARVISLSASAQMRPGAKVEKTHGMGLPRDMDKLLFDDHEYPDYPLKPGQEAYKDVDGYRIKDLLLKFTAISLRSFDDGEQYWGRITGTKYDRMTTELMADEYGKLGLRVTRQPFTVKELWYPTSWEGSYAAGTRSGALLTLFPINETVPTPAAGITAEAVWVGIGAAPDLIGRDLKGKAVIVYSTFVPGGRSHSASDRAGLFNSDTLITRAGAAMIINVMAVPGNGQFDPEGAPTGPGAVPTMTISQDEGFLLRDLLGEGQKVRISLKLAIARRENVPSQNVYAVLPGASDEEVMVMSHTDGFFQGAMDNASGMATAIDIARHYAAIPQAQRPRTMVFVATPDHHHGETGRDLMIRTHDWSKVALVLNAEHTSQTLLYMYNADLMPSNAVSARRWFASGSPAFQQLVKNTFQDFNVSVYKVPERRAGGSLGAVSPYAPSFHIIDHVIYHTSLDTPELVPAVGLGWSERAFLKIIDETNKMTMAEIRGKDKLPNPIR